MHTFVCMFVCMHAPLHVCLCVSVFCEGWVASLFNGSNNAMEVLVKFLALGHSREGFLTAIPVWGEQDNYLP